MRSHNRVAYACIRMPVRTQGMDVIEYYATYGHEAKVNLFHAVAMHNHNGMGSPYDLLVVPKDRIRKDYFTISASGVVQVRVAGVVRRTCGLKVIGRNFIAANGVGLKVQVYLPIECNHFARRLSGVEYLD